MNNFKMRLGAFLVASCMFTTSVPVYAASTNSNNTNASVSNSVEKTESKTSKVDDDVGIFEKIGRSIAPKLFASRNKDVDLYAFSALYYNGTGKDAYFYHIDEKGDLYCDFESKSRTPRLIVYDVNRIYNSNYALTNAGDLYFINGSETPILVCSNVERMEHNFIINKDGTVFMLTRLGKVFQQIPYNDSDIKQYSSGRNILLKDGSLRVLDSSGRSVTYFETKCNRKFERLIDSEDDFCDYTVRYGISDGNLYGISNSGSSSPKFETKLPKIVAYEPWLVDNILGKSYKDVEKFIVGDPKYLKFFIMKDKSVIVSGQSTSVDNSGIGGYPYPPQKLNIEGVNDIRVYKRRKTFFNTDNGLYSCGNNSRSVTTNTAICNGSAAQSLSEKIIKLPRKCAFNLTEFQFNNMQISEENVLINQDGTVKAFGGSPRRDNYVEPYLEDVTDCFRKPKIDPDLEPAKKAVEKAEKSISRVDYDSAKQLVDKLKPSGDKDSLSNRLDKLLKDINNLEAVEAANKAVEKAEDSLSIVDYKSGKDLVDKLDTSSSKDKLNKRLEEVLNKINEENKNSLEKAKQLVTKAELSLEYRDYNSALTVVNKISTEDLNKVTLVRRLKLIRESCEGSVREIRKIASNGGSTFILKSNGDVYGFGYGGSECLGLGEGFKGLVTSPVKLNVSNIKDVIALPQSNVVYFLNYDGEVYGCGDSRYGQLGTSTNCLNVPTKLPIDDVRRVVTDGSSTFFIKTNNEVWVCGKNDVGQLGMSSAYPGNQTSIVKISAEDIYDIQIGSCSTMYIDIKGKVYSSGRDSYGELSYRTGSCYEYLIDFPCNDYKDIARSGATSIVLKQDGTMWGCGDNSSGVLGAKKYNEYKKLTKLDVSDVESFCVDNGSSLFIKKYDKNIYAIGRGHYGQLGNGSELQATSFLRSDFKDISDMKFILSRATLSLYNGELYTSGYNSLGQLGVGDTENRSRPTKMGIDNIDEICSGRSCWYAIRNGNEVWVCGDNDYGQLGVGDTTIRLVPTRIEDYYLGGVDPNLEPAKKAVEQAEQSLIKSDYDKAKDLVDKVKPSSDKDDLIKRLEEVLKKITENDKDKSDLESATKAVENAESTLDKSYYDDAKKLVDKLKPSGDKDKLLSRLEEVLKKINNKENLNTEMNKLIKQAQTDIDSAEKNPNESTINTSKTSYDAADKFERDNRSALNNETYRDKINDIGTRWTSVSVIPRAIKSVEKVETTLVMDDYNKARNDVSLITRPCESVKADLNRRLDEVLNKIKEKEEDDKAVSNATKAVEKAEQSLSKDDYDKAKDLVDNLKPSKNKDDLTKRLDDVLSKIDKNELDNAKDLVSKAESSKNPNDKDKAQNAVDNLKPSKDKDDLQDRLNNIEVQDKNSITISIDKYEEKVKRIQADKSHNMKDLESLRDEGYIIQENINNYLNGDDASSLTSKLTKVIALVRDEITSINQAQSSVDKVKASKSTDDFIDAFVTVSSLIESAEKSRLKEELFNIFPSVIAGKSDAEIKNMFRTFKDLIEKGKVLKSDVERLMNMITDSKLRESIKNILEGVPDIPTIDKALEEATKLVEIAESSKKMDDINTARAVVNALKDSASKDVLSDRLDKIILDEKPGGVDTDSSGMDVVAGIDNIIILSLSNVGLDFSDYTGIVDCEKPGSIDAIVTSNRPYSLNLTMLGDMKGCQNGGYLKPGSLEVKLNDAKDYKGLVSKTPYTLISNHSAGENIVHKLDFNLKSNTSASVDKYKTTLKFEAVQE